MTTFRSFSASPQRRPRLGLSAAHRTPPAPFRAQGVAPMGGRGGLPPQGRARQNLQRPMQDLGVRRTPGATRSAHAPALYRYSRCFALFFDQQCGPPLAARRRAQRNAETKRPPPRPEHKAPKTSSRTLTTRRVPGRAQGKGRPCQARQPAKRRPTMRNHPGNQPKAAQPPKAHRPPKADSRALDPSQCAHSLGANAGALKPKAAPRANPQPQIQTRTRGQNTSPKRKAQPR